MDEGWLTRTSTEDTQSTQLCPPGHADKMMMFEDKTTLPRGNRKTDTRAGINGVGRIFLYLVTYLPYAVYSNNNMYRYY